MRTPGIDTLTAKIEKLENQVAKLSAKQIELAEARAKLLTLSSGENRSAMKARLMAQRAKADKLEALLASLEAEEPTDPPEDPTDDDSVVEND